MVRKLIVARVRDESGIVVVIVAVFMVVALGFTALVVDLGNGRQQRRQAQATADAAALAGAQEFVGEPGNQANWDAAVVKIKRYAYKNFGVDETTGWDSCSDPGKLSYVPENPSNTCISADSFTKPAIVRVRIPTRRINTLFAGVIGTSTLEITAGAEAKVETKTLTVPTPLPCAICVLEPSPGLGLNLAGNGTLEASGGNIVVNGRVSGNGGPTVATDHDTIIAGTPGPSQAGFTPPWVSGPPIEDPLAFLPAPAPMPPDRVQSGDILLPGTYTNITGTSETVLQPGLYTITGTLKGSFTGNGVMLYFPTPGKWIIADHDVINLSAPTPATCANVTCETYIGVNVYYDRGNTNPIRAMCDPDATTPCDAILDIDGTVYASAARLALDAPLGGSIKSAFIVGSISTTGTGGIRTDFDPGTNVTPPPTTQVVDAAPNLYK